MSFSDRVAADMSRLIDTDYFGSAATYIAPDGAQTALTVVLFAESTLQEAEQGIATKIRTRDCAWRAAVLGDVNTRAKIRIGTEDWSIARVVFRNEYQVTVALERHELAQHSRPDFRRK